MASISSKTIVKEILQTRGTCENPPIQIVYHYKAINGSINYALFTSPGFDDLKGQSTVYCQDVTCLMVNGMLTPEGEKLMSENT